MTLCPGSLFMASSPLEAHGIPTHPSSGRKTDATRFRSGAKTGRAMERAQARFPPDLGKTYAGKPRGTTYTTENKKEKQNGYTALCKKM